MPVRESRLGSQRSQEEAISELADRIFVEAMKEVGKQQASIVATSRLLGEISTSGYDRGAAASIIHSAKGRYQSTLPR